MSFRTSNASDRSARILCTVALGLLATACGGGGDESAAAEASMAATRAEIQPVSVSVTGCVLDRFYIPSTGTPVRALSGDGRLLGSASSDGHGRFTLQLPARSDVTLQIDRPDGESLPLRVNATASTAPNCLLDDRA